MQFDSDEEGVSFDMSPEEADDLAVHLSKLKTKGDEPKGVKYFRTKLFGYCNPRIEYHQKMAEEKSRK